MELVETLFSKSAREQMKQSRNGYKLSKFVQKIFADLFGYSSAKFECLLWQKTVAKPSCQSYNADSKNVKRFPLSAGGKPMVRSGKRF